MKDYIKHCIRENNPDHAIVHVGTNELDSERQPEMIAKSIIDVVKKDKNKHQHSQCIRDSPMNGNFSNKALYVLFFSIRVFFHRH